jgi:hypothetical protein
MADHALYLSRFTKVILTSNPQRSIEGWEGSGIISKDAEN